jgi:hypothetical protein
MFPKQHVPGLNSHDLRNCCVIIKAGKNYTKQRVVTKGERGISNYQEKGHLYLAQTGHYYFAPTQNVPAGIYYVK